MRCTEITESLRLIGDTINFGRKIKYNLYDLLTDGDVVKSTPWGLRRVFGFFMGIIYMIIML